MRQETRRELRESWCLDTPFAHIYTRAYPAALQKTTTQHTSTARASPYTSTAN